MRFLADENFPGIAVQALRSAGQDIVWIKSVAPGIPDREVLDWVARDNRILLTFDKDFGELARGSALPPASGVILIRIPMQRPTELGPLLVGLLLARTDWAGNFSVIEPGRVRMRSLTSLS